MKQFLISLIVLFLYTFFSPAQADDTSILNCVSKNDLSVDSHCVAEEIELNKDYKNSVTNKFSPSSKMLDTGHAIATIILREEQSLIEVIAQSVNN